MRSREELRWWELGGLATLLCSKSRRATLARLGGCEACERPWACECDVVRAVVDCERCGRSEGLLTGGWRCDVERTTAGEVAVGAAADMMIQRRERSRAYGDCSVALCALSEGP